MVFMCSSENEYKLIQFVRLHAYLCIVDELPVNTDECEKGNLRMNIYFHQ